MFVTPRLLISAVLSPATSVAESWLKKVVSEPASCVAVESAKLDLGEALHLGRAQLIEDGGGEASELGGGQPPQPESRSGALSPEAPSALSWELESAATCTGVNAPRWLASQRRQFGGREGLDLGAVEHGQLR